MKRLRAVFSLALFLILAMTVSSKAAVGDGKTVYGNTTAPTAAPKARDYSVGANWSAVSTLPSAATTIVRTVVKANHQADEYIAGVGTTGAASTLYVYTYSGGAWALSWSTTIPSPIFKRFDIAYEENSGDALVVYSTGTATNNELAFRKRVDGAWDVSSTNLSSARTNGVIEWIEMESRPGSDEIALAFADNADDLSAFIWDGSAWTSEPAASFNTTLPTSDDRKFDVAYEQSSGDVLIASGVASNATTVKYSLKIVNSTTWSTYNLAVQDIANFIDLCSEPNTNYIGFASLTNSATSADLQAAVWNGSNWVTTSNNRDLVASSVPYYRPVSCGWAGTGAQTKLMIIFADTGASANLTVSYYSWKKDAGAGTWEQAADSPATYSPPFPANKITRTILTNQDPNYSTNGKLWVTTIDTQNDLWTFTTTGTGASSWLTIDDGTAGNNAIETSVSTATYPCASLDITSFNPTLVELIGFKAETKDKEAVITWNTACELRTQGFKIYRTFLPDDPKSYEEITPNLILAAGNPFSGRQYQYIDKNPLQGVYYILEEVLKNGQTKRHGSVHLDDPQSFIGQDDGNPKKPFFRRDGRFELGGRVLSRRLRPLYFSEIKRGFYSNLNPVKVELGQEGIYRLSAYDLLAAGWDLNKINPNLIGIFNQGQEIPIYISGEKDGVFDRIDYLEFYGKPNSTRYTKTNVYWITLLSRPGIRMGEIDFKKAAKITTTYQNSEREQGNISYYPEFKGSEHWFFTEEFISPISFSFPFSLDHLAADQSQAWLTVNLQGGSRLGIGPDYNRQRAIIYLNNQLVGEANWNNDVGFTFSQAAPVSALREGNNTLTIEATDEAGALQQYFLLNWFEVSYSRKLFATGNKIVFDSNSQSSQLVAYQVRGFTANKIRGLATNSNQEVFRLDDAQIKRQSQGDYSFNFSDNNPFGKRYIIFGEESILKPLNIYPDTPSSLKDITNRADYIIIAHHDFLEGLKPLVDLRRGQGLLVKLIDIEDVYDEFNNGIFSPEAIKDFLSYAYQSWQSPKPVFVLLVGDATFDYQDFWELGKENLVPAYLVYSAGIGETVSDNWLVDFDNDILPEMFIGRLPVNNAAQLKAVIDKIASYEKQAVSSGWMKRAMFIADDEPEFEEVSDNLAGIFPSEYQVNKIYLSSSTPSDTRQTIIDNINQGRFIFNYVGHAGINLLSASGIFRNTDIEYLNNSSALPIFLSLNCLTGYFIYPEGLDSLSEAFLTAERKGIIAAITPSSLSSSPEQSIFVQGLYNDIFENKDFILGAIHFKAKDYLYRKLGSSTDSNSKAANIIQTYNLLGDPALIIRKSGAPMRYTSSLLGDLRQMLND